MTAAARLFDRRGTSAIAALIAGAATALAFPPFGFLPGLVGYGVLLGLFLLHQTPSPGQVVGILLVVVAGAAAQRSGQRPPSAGEHAGPEPSASPAPF